MSCESIDSEGHLCTIPGRHDEQHGYLDAQGQWAFWTEEVRRVSTRTIPTTEQITRTIEAVVVPIARPFPAPGNRLVRHTDPDTSRSAANAQRSLRVTETQRRIEELLRRNPEGLTHEEIRDAFPDASDSGLRTRCAELVDQGRVYDSGAKRDSQHGHPMIVWRAN